ncbi:MAG: type II toxin-antitoxin system PemK/MazF family toxin [Ignavibacteriales bacterium]|nr:type II toxin-antitoxin system PemK/MazF family toxin [Ignavibacteriales bacterium]
MIIKQFDIWLADLNPQMGTEAGKVRPVLILQTNLLNRIHPSTLICPLTTNVNEESEILRVHLRKGNAGLSEKSDIMIDQIRSIDNKRLMRKIGSLPDELIEKVKINVGIIFDLNE